MTKVPDEGTYKGHGTDKGLGRKFLAVDNNPQAIEVTAKRLLETTDKQFEVIHAPTLETHAYRRDQCPLCKAQIAVGDMGDAIEAHVAPYLTEKTRKTMGILAQCVASGSRWASVIRAIEGSQREKDA